MMAMKLIHAFMADIMETNNPYLRKLAGYMEEIFKPGVSEDTQGDITQRLRGLRMWVLQEMGALMAAEFDYGSYNKQNAERYIYSEALFIYATLLARIEVIEGMLGGKGNVTLTWAQRFEIVAGRFWYKWAWAQDVKMAAIPIFLLTFGHVVPFPVDLRYFIIAWAFYMLPSAINYTMQLFSMGMGFVTGLWRNPTQELCYFPAYERAAFTQHRMQNQYADFKQTASGGGLAVPAVNKWAIAKRTGLVAASIAAATVSLLAGGAISMVILPLAMAAIPAGLSLLNRAFQPSLIENPQMKLLAKIAALTAGGALLTAGAIFSYSFFPILWLNPVSLAMVANVGFGLYQLAMLTNSLVKMRAANKEISKPSTEGNFYIQRGIDMHSPMFNEDTRIAASRFAQNSLGRFIWDANSQTLSIAANAANLTAMELAGLQVFFSDSDAKKEAFKANVLSDLEVGMSHVGKLHLSVMMPDFDRAEKMQEFARRNRDRYVYDPRGYLMFRAEQGMSPQDNKELLELMVNPAGGAIPANQWNEIIGLLTSEEGVKSSDPMMFIVHHYEKILSKKEMREKMAVIKEMLEKANGRVKALFSLYNRSLEPAPTQGFNSVHLLNAAYNRYADIKAEFRAASGQLTTSRLLEMRKEIKATLTQLSAMREDGLYNQGIGHPFRMLSSEMIRLYGGIEMMIGSNVRQMLSQNPQNVQVREAAASVLAKLVDETNERIVLDFVRKTITSYQLTLPVRPWKDVFKGLVHLFVS
jgi:hypothetical protein